MVYENRIRIFSPAGRESSETPIPYPAGRELSEKYMLYTWGEITRFEMGGITGAQDWIAVLENAGALRAAATDIRSLSPELWSLLREDSEKAARIALFQIPEY